MKEAKYSTYEIRTRAVKAVQGGMRVPDVAEAYQIHRATIHRWVVRYKREGGEGGLIRRPVSGRPSLLDKVSKDEWLSIVLKPASHFGYETDFWTCIRLCNVIE